MGLETTGFLGVDYFGSRTGLGNSLVPDQIPQTSPMFGARLAYFILRSRTALALDLGIEAEFAFTPTFTGYGVDSPRMSYFAPVFGERGSLVLRLGRWPSLRPFVLAGAGGESIVSSSPFMEKDTDGVIYYGVGVVLAATERWQIRVEGRQGFMAARGGGTTETYEAQLGVGTSFGLASTAVVMPPKRVEVVEVKPVAEDIDRDRDGDGIPDRLDKCPDQPETVNGVEDADGCPESDRDGDGIVDSIDKCPDAPEDFDHFQDEDGCPDPDNDNDGIPDVSDACPNQPETVNGWQDADGCPDTVPDEIVAALLRATAVRFDAGRARLTPAGKLALDKPLAILREHGALRITITVHPDPDVEVAKKRADVVKWYLVEQGVAADQIATAIGEPAIAKGPTLELSLATK